eukprot:jgi/Botrbrau1/6082/Bobra.177_1s0020.1
MAAVAVPLLGGWQVAQLSVNRIFEFISRSPQVFEPPDGTMDGAAAAPAGTPEDKLAKALRLAFKASEGEVLEQAELDDESPGGAAVAVVLQIGTVVYAANLGDCMVVVLQKDGVRRLTQPHVPEVAVERERIETQGGSVRRPGGYEQLKAISNDRLKAVGVTRAIGDPDFKEATGRPVLVVDPSVDHINLVPHDRAIIIGTRSVWDAVGVDEKVHQILENVIGNLERPHTHSSNAAREAAAFADALVEAARASGAQPPCCALVGVPSWPTERAEGHMHVSSH